MNLNEKLAASGDDSEPEIVSFSTSKAENQESMQKVKEQVSSLQNDLFKGMIFFNYNRLT